MDGHGVRVAGAGLIACTRLTQRAVQSEDIPATDPCPLIEDGDPHPHFIVECGYEMAGKKRMFQPQ